MYNTLFSKTISKLPILPQIDIVTCLLHSPSGGEKHIWATFVIALQDLVIELQPIRAQISRTANQSALTSTGTATMVRAWSPWSWGVWQHVNGKSSANPQNHNARSLNGQLTVPRVKSTIWLRGRRKCYNSCVEWITFIYQVGKY